MRRLEGLALEARDDLGVLWHHLGCEVLEDLGRLEGPDVAPGLLVIMITWRSIDDLAILTDGLHDLVVEVEVVEDGPMGHEVPHEEIRASATTRPLMNEGHEVTPGHAIEFHEDRHALPELEGLVVITTLNRRPLVGRELEDLRAELPLQVWIAWMLHRFEEPEAIQRNVLPLMHPIFVGVEAARGPGGATS